MLPIWTLRLASAAMALLTGCAAAVAFLSLGYWSFAFFAVKPSMPAVNLLWLAAGFAAGTATLDLYRHMMKLRDIW